MDQKDTDIIIITYIFQVLILSGEFSKTINNRRNEEYYITKF